jgi:hypothetical protein
MIQQIKTLGLSEKPVLSHYPKDYSEYEHANESNQLQVPRMCKSFFNERGMLSFMGAEIISTDHKPYNTPYLASGMFFCEGYFLYELPYDPNLPYLFVGEEILHSIRFYTFGWDIFTPTENVVFHEYTRAEKPKIWTDNPYYSDEEAFKKVKQYLHLIEDSNIGIRDDVKVNMDKYGLGNVRNLQDYFNFAGIDIKNKTVHTNFCRDGNKASEQDIKESNKIIQSNIPTAENFQQESSNMDWISFMVAFALLVGFLIYRRKN